MGVRHTLLDTSPESVPHELAQAVIDFCKAVPNVTEAFVGLTSIAEALLLLSYPLHPPNKPGQLRTAHFSSLRTPALFVQGTKDPFGSIEEMRAALSVIPAKTVLMEVVGAGHDGQQPGQHRRRAMGQAADQSQ